MTRQLRTTFVARISLGLAAAVVFLWQNARVKVLSDFSYIIENAHRIALGDVPYRDFVIPHAPLTFLFHAAIIRLFHGSLMNNMLFTALEAGATAALTYAIVRRLSSMPPVLVAAPVVFLNGYAVVAMPFYDGDAILLVLLAVWSVLRVRERHDTGWRSAAAGALLVLPIFAKQNIGIAACVATHAALVVSAIVERDPRLRRGYVWTACGSVAALAMALLLIQLFVGLGTYVHWTIEYAAARRWPRAGLLLSLFSGRRTWIFAAALVAAYGLLRRGAAKDARWMTLAGLAVLAAPLAEATPTMIRWGLASRADMLWGGVTIGTLAAAAVAIARGHLAFERTLPLAAVGTALGAFASQGVFDSSYAVWPLLLIAVAPLASLLIGTVRQADRALVRACLAGCLVALAALGARLVARAERLQFADTTGAVGHATLKALRGLSTGGTYIADFEQLVQRTDALIPRDAHVASVPGEDPFFFATGRRPALPVLWFDDTSIPYDTAELLRLFDERAITWVIVKHDLQLKNTAWAPLEVFVSRDLASRYRVVERLPRYSILTRKEKL